MRPAVGRRRPIPTAAVALAVAAVLAGAVAGCGGDDGGNGGDVPPGTAFVGTVPLPGGGAGTLPPPVGIGSLDGVDLELRKIAEVREPVSLSPRPGTSTLYLAEKTGRIKAMTVDRTATDDGKVVRSSYRVDPDPLVDVTAEIDDRGERGLLGLAFSPDGDELYTFATARSGTVMVDAYRMDGDRVDTGSRRALLRLDHPRSNHNGGQLATGPDGYLYVGLGDGGGAGDPDGNGQDPRTLYGTIVRIDPRSPSGGRPYGIPEGNPFRDGRDGAPEVWAWGLRNPWRFSFDRRTGDLWVGDVGQNEWEEIDLLPAGPDGASPGANLGWSRMEGNHPYEGGTPPEGHLPPIYDYPRSGGACSVIGGYVYRGATHPDRQGVYVWADYCAGEVQLLLRRPDGRVEQRGTGKRIPEGPLGPGLVTSFGEDADGELYVLSPGGGVYLIEWT